MTKKFICSVCGYIHEGTEAPEQCPLCKAPASKFTEVDETAEAEYATVHKIGEAKTSGADEEMIKDLNAH
ncbi:MAG: NADH peroxidase, partial [Prevotella sp.]|nr:NADH peroxidase [Prevotella sp.]